MSSGQPRKGQAGIELSATRSRRDGRDGMSWGRPFKQTYREKACEVEPKEQIDILYKTSYLDGNWRTVDKRRYH